MTREEVTAAARALAAMRRTRGKGSGRPRKPTACPRCGQIQPSARQARAHCMSAGGGSPS
jgi:hypothetical protein